MKLSSCETYLIEIDGGVGMECSLSWKDAVEAILPDCSGEIQDIYKQTKEGNGQRWMMIDLEDKGKLYDDVFRLIEIRRG